MLLSQGTADGNTDGNAFGELCSKWEGGPAGDGLGAAWTGRPTCDIEYKDAPIYNIETYGYDPLNGTYEYPFYQWNGWDIRHYVTAYGYSSSGSWISISDPAVKGSYTAAQRYTQWYSDVWVAINNLPLTNQILW